MQRQSLNEVMSIVKEEVPLVYDALIGERDIFMAKSIALSKAESIVAVVGMAHMTGIERNLNSQFGYEIIERKC